MQHVFAREAAETELSVDTVVQHGDVFGRNLLRFHVQGRIGCAMQFPGHAFEKAFHTAVFAERRGLDTQDVLLAGQDDPVFGVNFGGFAGSGVDEGAGGVVHQVEIGRGETFQGTGIGNGDFNGVHQQAVIAHFGADFHLLHQGRRFGAAGCSEHNGPNNHKSLHLRWLLRLFRGCRRRRNLPGAAVCRSPASRHCRPRSSNAGPSGGFPA